jgi:hypothetical protein
LLSYEEYNQKKTPGQNEFLQKKRCFSGWKGILRWREWGGKRGSNPQRDYSLMLNQN